MTLCYSLMLLSEISFYFAVINCLLYNIRGILGVPGEFYASSAIHGIPVLIICVIIGTLGYLLDKNYAKWRFVLLPLLLFVFCFTTDFISYPVILLPAGYVAFRLILRRYNMEYHDKVAFIRTGMFLSVFLFLIFVIFLHMERILLYLILFLLSGICLLRFQRQQFSQYHDFRYQFFNILPISLVFLLAFCFRSDFFLIPFDRAIMFLYEHLVSPFTNWIITMILRLLSFLLSLFSSTRFKLFENPLEDPVSTDGEDLLNTDNSFVNTLILLIQLSFVFLAFLILFYKLYKTWKIHKNQPRKSEPSVSTAYTETVQNLHTSAIKEKRLSNFLVPGDHRKAVCFYYRNFLQFLHSIGISFTQFHTSLDIQVVASNEYPEEILSSIRNTYLRARYGSGQITTEDVSRIKNDIKKIKQHKKESS